jgi:hypothetical protein
VAGRKKKGRRRERSMGGMRVRDEIEVGGRGADAARRDGCER